MGAIFLVATCDTKSNASIYDDTAFNLLQQSMITMSETDGILISFSSETIIYRPTAMDFLIDIQNNGVLYVINLDPTTFKAKAEVTQGVMDSEITFIAYFKNNILYVDLRETELGFGIIYDTQPQSALSLIGLHLDFSESTILNQSIEETLTGTQLSFSLTADALLEVVNGQLEVLSLELENLEKTDYELIIHLDDNHMIRSAELEVHLIYQTDDEVLEISMTASLEINLADHIIFEFPTDLDEFIYFDEKNLFIS